MVETRWYRNKETGLAFEFEAGSLREKQAATNPDLEPVDAEPTEAPADLQNDGTDEPTTDTGAPQV